MTEPDYARVATRDLLDIARHIDRHRFPERHARLHAEIERRQHQSPEEFPAPPTGQSAWGHGFGLGGALGFAAGIAQFQLTAHAIPAHSCGADRGFALMGLAVCYSVAGSVLGAAVGAFFRAL